jgi:hypothetical protein
VAELRRASGNTEIFVRPKKMYEYEVKPTNGERGFPKIKAISSESGKDSNYGNNYLMKVHIVESSHRKKIQDLVNKNTRGFFFDKLPASVSVSRPTEKAYQLDFALEDSIAKGLKDGVYLFAGQYEWKGSPTWARGIDLGGMDAAANMWMVGYMPHYMGIDNLMKAPFGKYNRARPECSTAEQKLTFPCQLKQSKKSFLTFSASGMLHHNFEEAFIDREDGEDKGTLMARHFCSKYEKEGNIKMTGFKDGGRMNEYWVDVSPEMFSLDPVQWLQNYRRCRWMQLRNIFIAFQFECLL